METDDNQSNIEFMKNCLDILRIDNEYIVNAREERDRYREMYQQTYDDLIESKSSSDTYISILWLSIFLIFSLNMITIISQIQIKNEIIQKIEQSKYVDEAFDNLMQIQKRENDEHTK
jgi:hypothetical protein